MSGSQTARPMALQGERPMPDDSRRSSIEALFEEQSVGEITYMFDISDQEVLCHEFYQTSFQEVQSQDLNQAQWDLSLQGDRLQDVADWKYSPTGQEDFADLVNPTLFIESQHEVGVNLDENKQEGQKHEMAVVDDFIGMETPFQTPSVTNFEPNFLKEDAADASQTRARADVSSDITLSSTFPMKDEDDNQGALALAIALPHPQTPPYQTGRTIPHQPAAFSGGLNGDCIDPNLILNMPPTSTPIGVLRRQAQSTGPAEISEFCVSNGWEPNSWDREAAYVQIYSPKADNSDGYDPVPQYQVSGYQFTGPQFMINGFQSQNGFGGQLYHSMGLGTPNSHGTLYPSPPIKPANLMNPPSRPPTAQPHMPMAIPLPMRVPMQAPLPMLQKLERYDSLGPNCYPTAPTSPTSTVDRQKPLKVALAAGSSDFESTDLITNKRADPDDPAKVARYYKPTPSHEIPQPWGPPQKPTLFRYTKDGEWEADVMLDDHDLLFYIQNQSLKDPSLPGDIVNAIRQSPHMFPTDCVRLSQLPDRLVIWVQNPPAQLSWRYATQKSSKCRYAQCPDKNNTILKGFWRVCFDERPHHSGVVYDPFRNAGYMHLWCFEKAINVPHLLRGSEGKDPNYPGWANTNMQNLIRGDTRRFRFERESPMSITRDHASCQEVFTNWVKREINAIDDPKENRLRAMSPEEWKALEMSENYRNEQRLWHQLTSTHLEEESQGRAKVRDGRQGNNIGFHKGDMEVFAKGVEKKRRIDKRAKRAVRDGNFGSWDSSSDGQISPKGLKRLKGHDYVDSQLDQDSGDQESSLSEPHPDIPVPSRSSKRKWGSPLEEEAGIQNAAAGCVPVKRFCG